MNSLGVESNMNHDTPHSMASLTESGVALAQRPISFEVISRRMSASFGRI